jgi:hypothetical protein
VSVLDEKEAQNGQRGSSEPSISAEQAEEDHSQKSQEKSQTI